MEEERDTFWMSERDKVRTNAPSLSGAGNFFLAFRGPTMPFNNIYGLLFDSHHDIDICIPKMPQFWNSIFYNVLDLQGWNVEVHWCFTLQTLCGQIPCELYLTNTSKSNKSPSKLTIFTNPTKKTNQNPPINSKSQQHKQRNSSKPRFFLG